MYSEKEARELVIEAGHKLLENKLIARTWGNISARISEDYFIITPSGKGYENLREDELVKVAIKDCSYDGDIKPSSEKGIHASVYQMRSDVNFIIHTHQYYASAISADRRDTSFSPCVDYAISGTKNLRKNVKENIKQNPLASVFLLSNHGTLVLGKSYEESFKLAEELELKSEELVNKRVPSSDVIRNEEIDLGRIETGFRYSIIEQDRYIEECCRAGVDLRAYLDDFAQIVGIDAKCCDNNAKEIKKAARGRNAVLVKGVGAICYADTLEDAEAIAMIVSKNSAAACYVRNEKPLGKLDSLLQRYVYLNKYSKQKDA